MDRSAKILALFSFLIIFSGLGLLLLGSKPQVSAPSPTPAPLVETSPDGTSSASLGIEGERVLVTEVIDGDTLEIEGGLKVRLIGVDTPETKDPRRPIGCFGKEASQEVKNLIEGKVVILQKDISNTDKYQRLLRYVYLPLEDGNALFVNDYLVREGFGLTLTYPPDVKYALQFREAETQAKELKKGLWGKC